MAICGCLETVWMLVEGMETVDGIGACKRMRNARTREICRERRSNCPTHTAAKRRTDPQEVDGDADFRQALDVCRAHGDDVACRDQGKGLPAVRRRGVRGVTREVRPVVTLAWTAEVV